MAQLPLQTHVYISTLMDLEPGEMLKVDVAPGVYELMEYEWGYLFIENTTNVKDIKVVKIFNSIDGDFGLGGSDWDDGETSDPDHMRLYNDNICNELLSEWRQEGIYQDNIKPLTSEHYLNLDDFFIDSEDNEDFDDDDGYDYEEQYQEEYGTGLPAKGRRLQELGRCHNLPVLFYLNREVVDLRAVNMIKEPSGVPGNSKDLVVWRVEENGDFIGYAVNSIFHEMVGNRAGVAMYEGAKAFGNFQVLDDDVLKHAKESNVFWYNNLYKCTFSPCTCRTVRKDYEDILYSPSMDSP